MMFKIPLLIAAASLTVCNVEAKSYKVCVPNLYLEACERMVQVETKSKAVLECIGARDRVECLSFVQQRQADVVPADPEDMYVATKIPNQDFVLFQEYRSDEEPDAEFRYEAVIVIHKDLPITSLDGLRGLKSCHTGVNRNVGYKIPLTMLMRRSVFPKMNDRSVSPKENELKAYSSFFRQSCIVGDWSPDPKTNTVWKSHYSNLCALCEHPEICNYPDNYSGYDGALRCLAHNGGEVAFTKVIFVRKFFGLPVGTTPASESSENPDNFAYLCADGSKVPIRSKACSWAARPWQGLLGHNDVLASLTPLKQKIKQLADIGAATKADWTSKVLGLSDKIHYVAENIPIKPLDYLNKANYTAVIERGHGAPEPIVRLCVTSTVALSKCRTMSVFAFSRDIRPRLDCVQKSSEEECLIAVRDNGADLVSVDGPRVAAASKAYKLHPVFHEVYGADKTPAYAVAVVKRGSGINNVDDLQGKRSCHSGYGTFEGWDAIVHYLISKNIIRPEQCPRGKYFAQFFTGGSCVPGANKLENNPAGDNPASLTQQCQPVEANDAAQCLKDNRGDVAFMSSLELSRLDGSQYELLCLNKELGGRDTLSPGSAARCNVALAPTRAWLSATDFLSDVSIAHTPLSLAQTADERGDLFNMFGEYLKNDNVIFNNAATGLATTETFDFSKFKAIHDAVTACN